MSCGLLFNLSICKGATFVLPVRWGVEPMNYIDIQAVSNDVPARISAAGHGLVSGWPVAITNVRGMKEINAPSFPPPAESFHECTVVDADTIDLHEVNSIDYGTYVSGGILQYWTMPDLSSYTAVLEVTDPRTGEVIFSFSSVPAVEDIGTIAIDVSAGSITIEIPATNTKELAFQKAAYVLSTVSVTGKVNKVIYGNIKLS